MSDEPDLIIENINLDSSINKEKQLIVNSGNIYSKATKTTFTSSKAILSDEEKNNYALSSVEELWSSNGIVADDKNALNKGIISGNFATGIIVTGDGSVAINDKTGIIHTDGAIRTKTTEYKNHESIVTNYEGVGIDASQGASAYNLGEISGNIQVGMYVGERGKAYNYGKITSTMSDVGYTNLEVTNYFDGRPSDKKEEVGGTGMSTQPGGQSYNYGEISGRLSTGMSSFGEDGKITN